MEGVREVVWWMKCKMQVAMCFCREIARLLYASWQVGSHLTRDHQTTDATRFRRTLLVGRELESATQLYLALERNKIENLPTYPSEKQQLGEFCVD